MNFIIKLVLSAIAVVITAYVLPGVHIDSFFVAVMLAAVLSLLNVSVKPLLVFLTIPATIFSLGLFLLVINAFIIQIAAWIVPGFEVSGFWWALLFSLLLSFVNGIFDRLTVKAETREDKVKIYGKDGKRVL